VVIENLVIIRQSLWMTQVILWAVVGESPRRSVEELARREHLIFVRIKEELHHCMWKDQDAQEGGELGFSKN
jgi:hypothetical protein